MQIVSIGHNLHEMSNPVSRKNVSVCRLLKILPRMLSIKKQVSSRKMHETPTYFWIFKQIPELEYNKALC